MSDARRDELRALVRLSVPLVAAQLGSQAMAFVDTAMVGRLGTTALAGAGIGDGIYFAVSLVGYGCVMGCDPLVAQAVGAGEPGRAYRVRLEGRRLAVWVGLPLVALLAVGHHLATLLGVEPATRVEVRRYLLGRLPGTIPFLWMGAERSYLQARGLTRPIVLAVALANVVNFVGNALLIYGDDALRRAHLPPVGLPRLGVFGAGLASSLSMTLAAAVLTAAVAASTAPRAGEPALRDGAGHDADPRAVRRAILGIGAPIGLQMFAEVGAFALVGLLAGRIGADAAAGHQIAVRLASCTFTVAVGIGSATAVRVGLHIGRRDLVAARRAGALALLVAAGFMSCTALTFLVAPRALARIFTDDPGALAAAAPLVMIAAFFQLSDGQQAVAAGALRGAGDTRASLYANVAGHYGVGIPIALALGFPLALGARGLWWGLSAGLTAVAIALVVRFVRITRAAP